MTKAGYYRRLARIYRAYERRAPVLPYLPLRLWIEPTTSCNLRCVMCPNKELPPEGRGSMDPDLFRKVVAEADGFAHEVNLTHRGESLLHPDFPAMVETARRAGLVTKLHTNATRLTEALSAALLDAGLDQLTFSFDGYDRETYESVRVGADFERTAENIRRFLELKKVRQARRPRAILELIDFPDRPRDPAARRAFLARFRGLPLDRIRVKAMHNWAGEVPAEAARGRYSPCTFLWASLVVLWDGTVLPCTQDFFGALTLGNVRENSLAEIWNGPRLTGLRERAARGDIDSLHPCAECDRPWRRTVFGVPREYFWKLLLRRMP